MFGKYSVYAEIGQISFVSGLSANVTYFSALSDLYANFRRNTHRILSH